MCQHADNFTPIPDDQSHLLLVFLITNHCPHFYSHACLRGPRHGSGIVHVSRFVGESRSKSQVNNRLFHASAAGLYDPFTHMQTDQLFNTQLLCFRALLVSTVEKSKTTTVLNCTARTVAAVLSRPLASCPAVAHQAFSGHTVSRGARCRARMEEPASKTHPVHSSTAAAAHRTSLDHTVRAGCPHHAYLPAHTFSVSVSRGIKCAMNSVTTTNVSGMEETAHSTGNSLGVTAPPVSPAGICLKTEYVIRSVTTLGVYLTASSARRLNQRPASMSTPWSFVDAVSHR